MIEIKQGSLLQKCRKRPEKVLMLASVASMIDQFNMPNIRLMQEMGYEVHAACNFKEGNTCDGRRLAELKHKLNDRKVFWHQWDCPRSICPVQKCARAYWQLDRLLKKHAFAWIHCHSPIGGALARIAAHRAGIPVIYTAHGFHFYKGAPLKNWLLFYPAEKLLARWTDVLVTVNKEDYGFAKRKLKAGKVCCIPGVGIDTGQFRKRTPGKKEDFCRKYQIPKDARIVLSVGELSRRKNHQVMIAALAGLKRQDVYYLLCGQGMLRKPLMRYAKKLGVGDRVRMPGFVENVAELYQNADVFVFPSLQEGMPKALMEAMAAGMPCVVSDIRGNRELVSGQGGRRFSLDDPAQLQAALHEFFMDRHLCEMCGGLNREIIKKYDSAAVNKKVHNIYRYMHDLHGAGQD